MALRTAQLCMLLVLAAGFADALNSTCIIATHGVDSPDCGLFNTSACLTLQQCIYLNRTSADPFNLGVIEISMGSGAYYGAGYCGINVTTGQLIQIQGPDDRSSIIDCGSQQGPVFSVTSTHGWAVLMLYNVTLRSGSDSCIKVDSIGNLFATGVTFVNCSSQGDGGAVFLADRGNGTGVAQLIQDCTFISNTAARHGGAIRMSDNMQTVGGCVFINNSALSGDGGAVWGHSVGILMDSSFKYNSANQGKGGALWTDGWLHVENVSISYCSAQNGGGIYTTDGPGLAVFSDSQLYKNSAQLNGGAICLENAWAADLDYLEISGTISGNSALQYGGGIYVSNVASMVLNSLVTANTAVEGPGIYYQNCTNLHVYQTSGYVAMNSLINSSREGLDENIACSGLTDLPCQWCATNNCSVGGCGAVCSSGPTTPVSNDTIWKCFGAQNNCSGHGTCFVTYVPSYQCQCDAGYKGNICDEHVAPAPPPSSPWWKRGVYLFPIAGCALVLLIALVVWRVLVNRKKHRYVPIH